MNSDSTTQPNIVPVITLGEPLGAGIGAITAAGFAEPEAHELAEAIANKYVVTVADDAPCYCIDGRNCVHSKASKTNKPQIGPSLAGGALVTAYAAAELVPGYFTNDDPHAVVERIASVKKILDTSAVEKIVLGAHTVDGDTHGATGCGASDKFADIMAKPSEHKDTVDAVTALLLGEEHVNPYAMDFTSSDTLQAQIADYNAASVLGMIPDNNIEVLTGTHAELLVLFNFNSHTTIDRDAVVAETGKQVFVVDMWYIDKLAHAMSVDRPDAVIMNDKLRHAMTAFQVSTYLTLCDGTHRPVLLRSGEQEVAS